MAKEVILQTQKRIIPIVLICLGVLGAILAAILILRHPPKSVNSPAVSVQQAEASTKPPTEAVDNYEVAPDLPKYIAIPSIRVDRARVLGLGTIKNNQPAVPDNIFDTGWYKESAKPGQNGAMFIYGHISNWQANGVFYDLKKLKPGDNVTITRGDDSQHTYTVVRSETYPADNVPMDKVLAPVAGNEPGLNLMTCAGQVIEGTDDFTERLVVYTSLIKS